MAIKGLSELLKATTSTRVYTLPEDISEMTGFTPRDVQAEIMKSLVRFNVLLCHRRMGKTLLAAYWLVQRALDCPFPDGRYAYFGPTYSQTKDIVWMYIKNLTERIPGRLVSESELSVTIPTRRGAWARIRLYGVDSPKQRVRGLYLDGAVFDEYGDIPASVWFEQVRPMLTDDGRNGVDVNGRPNQWVIFMGTPKGRNHFYDMWLRADLWMRGLEVEQLTFAGEKVMVKRDDWYAGVYKASQTKILKAAELTDALADMGLSRYEQEFECSFDAAVEGAIYAREIAAMRAEERVRLLPALPTLPVNTAWDLGYDDATAIWFFQQQGDAIRLLDYYEATQAGFEHYVDVLERRNFRYGYHLFPHDIEVHELGSGKSRANILRQMGVRVSVVPRHKVADGIAAVQALLPRCYADELKCIVGLDRMSMYRREFDEKNGRFRDNPKHDGASHGADAFRTLAMGLRRARSGGAPSVSQGVY